MRILWCLSSFLLLCSLPKVENRNLDVSCDCLSETLHVRLDLFAHSVSFCAFCSEFGVSFFVSVL